METSIKAKKPIAKARVALLKGLRAWFEKEGFLEVETPSLTRFTCPEPHLYPLRVTLHDIDLKEHQGHLILSQSFL